MLVEIAAANGGYVTASEAKARGIQNRELADAVDRGELVKTARGLYCMPETWEDEYVRAQHRFARGIFSHDTALYLLGLSDSAPESLTMTFPRGYNPSSAKKSGIITKSSPAELHELGCIELGTPYGNIVRAYNAESYQEDKFEKANTDLTQNNLFIGRSFALLTPVMTAVSSGLTLAIYWIGAHLIEDVKIPTDPTKIAGAMEDKVHLFSDMVVYSSYAMQVVMGFMMMIVVFFLLPRAVVAAGRINEVLDTQSSVSYPENSSEKPKEVGTVEFDDVSFRYSETSEPVLEHVSFKAKKGDTVAFIGSTGSGKSTLVNLIPRFYDATQGTIKVDGVDVRHYDHETLHNIVGYIPQKAVLFSGDITSNMTMGTSNNSPLDDAKIWEALELAQGKDFVENKEGQLKAEVAQAGSNFSGGQKQRLAIARALARKPEILIFDDSFSALDYKTDRKLRQELSEKTQDMTKLIVAQRISTIMDADQILVLDQGKVVGQGTHKELLANNEVYQEIAYSQLSKEELENGK